MKILLFIFILISGCGTKRMESKPEGINQSPTSIYEIKANAIDGSEIDFNVYRGKKLLIVNTASECGFTPQYEDLQKLHEKYKGKITVLGFPSNDFGGQEPGTNEEIVSFCSNNYNITFQLFEKSVVKGKNKSALYSWLSSKEKNGWNESEPGWNFCKYLINEEGELVNFYGSAIKPLSEEIISKL